MTRNLSRELVVVSALLGGCAVPQGADDTDVPQASITTSDPAPTETLDHTVSPNAMTGGPQLCTFQVKCASTGKTFLGGSQISLEQAYSRALQACIAACPAESDCIDLAGHCTRLD